MKSLKTITETSINLNSKILLVLVTMMYVFTSCEFDTEIDTSVTYYAENELSITQYIESNPESFSTLFSILDTTGLDHLFRTYGDYTFLAPVNSAFDSYFKDQGMSSFRDMDSASLRELVMYHIFDKRLTAGSFNMGIVEGKTLSLDIMVSGPSEDGADVVLNKKSTVLTQDIILPNGVVHAVDHVIEKPENTIFDWLTERADEYSIFIEALEKTGVKEKVASNQNFYTCFITSDDKYKESGIDSFEKLVALISPDDNNYNDTLNLLNGYIGSALITDILSISDASEEQVFYGTEGGATIKFGLKPSSAEVVLNYQTTDFPEGLDVDEFNSNNLTKNGIIHVMDTMLQVTKTFERITRNFVFLDVPGFPYDSLYDYGIDLFEEQGVRAQESGGNGEKGSEKWLLGQWAQWWPRPGGPGHIPFERTNGWLTLNAPYSGNIKSDHHRNWQYMPLFFTFEYCDELMDVTRKFPYIIPGKYRLIHHLKAGNARPSIKHYFDGEPIGGIFNLALRSNSFQDIELGVVEIKENEPEHFLRIQALTPGKGFFVEIRFEPID